MKIKHTVFRCGLLGLTLLIFGGYLLFMRSRTDRTGPEITIAPGVPEFSVFDDRQAYLQGVTARDNRDGDVTGDIILESVYGITPDHQATVTYAAFDSAGNVTTAERQVRFTDYRSPRFTLKTSLVFPENSGIDIMDYIGAEDVFDGDVVRWVRATIISNAGTLSDVGNHSILLQVTNSLGDTSELVLPVEVYASGKYNGQLELKDYLVYLPVGASFDANAYLDSVTCAGREHSLPSSAGNISVSIDNSVNSQVPGVYPVTYTVHCVEGSTTYTARSRLFVVVEE